MPTGQLKEGKVKACYALPGNLVERIGIKAIREKRRACQVVEDLLSQGLGHDEGTVAEPKSDASKRRGRRGAAASA